MVAVWEYDTNKKAIKDSGYQTSSLTLQATTEYVRLLCTTKNYSNVTLEDMLANSNITVEAVLTDYSKIIDYSELNKRIYKVKDIDENFINLNSLFWELGSYTQSNGLLTSVSVGNRIRTKQAYGIEKFSGKRRLYYSVPVGYKLGGMCLDSTGAVISDLGSSFLTGTGSLYLMDGTTKILPILAYTDDRSISLEALTNLEVTMSLSPISYKLAELDKTKLLQAANTNQQVSSPKIFTDKVRYIGHSGTATYAPLKIQSNLTVWRQSWGCGEQNVI
ncbi:hypothetical protein OVA29_08820 [Exiguobacterium sp. SL14]|nr:hypothetical protein [Exiguobacterium sp. SL14]MCY1690756.1 hypothetical protein [Exiguobacterium sp. SL14]